MIRTTGIRKVQQEENIRIKPVYLMHQKGLSVLEKQAVLDGARELIQIAETPVEVVDYGNWKHKDFKNPDGSLKKYHSTEWYIEKSAKSSKRKNKLNAGALMNYLRFEPWRDIHSQGKPHYDILVVNSDMYVSDANFVIGVGYPGIGTAISTSRFHGLKDRKKYECIKTMIMHELGHAFGLIRNGRTRNVENSLGPHCTNRCTMRQGLSLPDDWIKMSQDRLKHGALCGTCETDLKNYFKSR